MKSLDALAKILKFGQPVFRTSDAACVLEIGNAHASKTLFRLAEAGQVVRVAHSLWALPDRVDKLAVPEHLTAPWPSYISLQTALFHHGMISQIPVVTYAVSLSRSKAWQTPLGAFSVHRITPSFFFGFESANGVHMAVPEKALLDVLYLSPAKSNLFKNLPELDLSGRFQAQSARRMIEKIQDPRRRSVVERRLEALLNG